MQELSLFNQPAQVEATSFQTFTTEYVAQRYGVVKHTIRNHKAEHSDEIIENLHFIVERNRLNRPLIKWTLRGIIKLGMFIRSPEAKNFRLWAEAELEKSILKELERAKEARKANLELVDKIANLEAIRHKEIKHYKNQINGYKSQIIQHNEQIINLKIEINQTQQNKKLLNTMIASAVFYAVKKHSQLDLKAIADEAVDIFHQTLEYNKNLQGTNYE